MAEDRPETPEATMNGGATADRVAAIISAAEQTAEAVRREAEERARARIAEGDRAAQYRVDAAEAEAQELLETARGEAERLQHESQERSDSIKSTATSEAMQIVANAQRHADETLAEATRAAAEMRSEAERVRRELVDSAHAAAEAVHGEGTELVGNLRAMGDSLRANSERLLRDVQALHSQMIARIEVVDDGRHAGSSRGERPARSRPPREDASDIPDVPEFIPRR